MKANTPASKKAKGSRLEREFAALLRHKGLDGDAKRMLMSGAGYLKGDIYTTMPYSFECKNTERLNFWGSWEQAEAQAGNKTPVVVYSSNFRPMMVIMKADDWADLLVMVKDQLYGS